MTDEIRTIIEKLGEGLSQDEVDDASRAAAGEGPPLPGKLTEEDEEERQPVEEGEESEKVKDIRAQISEMKLPDKIKLAMLGNSTCRGLLILDTNRMIQQIVLRNPKLRLNEVEAFAKNTNMAEGVLRSIADNKEWMRSYALKCSLVMNSRTPGDVALKWLRFLNSGDLKKISKSKNVPQLISVTAKKRLADMDKG